MGDDAQAEALRPRGDRLGDGTEGQQPEHADAQAVDGIAGLPLPGPGTTGLVVSADLPRRREEQGHRVVGHLVLAPVTGDVGDEDPAAGGGLDIDDVDPGSVSCDDLAAGERADRLRADRGVLGDDRVRVPGDVDHLVFGLALGGRQREAGTFDDGPLNGHTAEVIVGDDDGLRVIAAHFARPCLCAMRPAVPPGTEFWACGQVMEAPSDAPRATREYSERIPLSCRGSSGFQMRLRSSSMASTPSGARCSPLTPTISSSRRGTLISIRSPSSTRAIGPPSIASGATCPMHGPFMAPEYRPSVTIAVVVFKAASLERMAVA